MDRFDSMRIFLRVAEIGSFAAVARQMDVARSVITRQVAALEAHLGVKLIARSTRSLTLTSAGSAYLESCLALIWSLAGKSSTSSKPPRAVWPTNARNRAA